MNIKLNGTVFPIDTDQDACEVVDYLIWAAAEADYVPHNGQDVGEWAEDMALYMIANS